MKIEGLNQVQVMAEIGLTFAAALRSILRQDPDIIMIGEIRDDETARIAVRASITGHLVLSTIHTNNSLNTIERLTDMEVERYLLGAALTGIVSQRLCKSLCPHCRKLRATSDYEKLLFKEVLGKDVNEIYEPVGCDKCIDGYKGRIAIHEVLIIDQEIRDGIVDNISKEELRHLVYNRDNQSANTLLKDGLQKVLNGYTSFEEILRIIDIDEDLGDEDERIKNALIGNKKAKTSHTNLEETHVGKVDTTAFGDDDESRPISEENKVETVVTPQIQKPIPPTSTVVTPQAQTSQTISSPQMPVNNQNVINPSQIQRPTVSPTPTPVTPNVNNTVQREPNPYSFAMPTSDMDTL